MVAGVEFTPKEVRANGAVKLARPSVFCVSERSREGARDTTMMNARGSRGGLGNARPSAVRAVERLPELFG